jgi:hypothetical protein
MTNHLQEKIQLAATYIFGVSFMLFWIWGIWFSFLSFRINYPFDWIDFVALFLPLLFSAFVFLYLLWPGKQSSMMRRKFLTIYGVLTAVIIWLVGPIQTFFVLNLTDSQISLSAFNYLIEGLVFGSAVLYVVLNWLKKVDDFLRDYHLKIKAIGRERVEEVSETISTYPLRVSVLGSSVVFFGYIIAALILLFFGETNYRDVIKDALTGLAIAPILFLLVYVITYKYLQGVNEILYVFGDVVRPRRVLSLGQKMILLGAGLFLLVMMMFLPLFWDCLTGSILSWKLVAGLIMMSLEFVVIIYFAIRSFVSDLEGGLAKIEKGLEILQSKDWDYRLNIKTGDELEDIAYDYNRAIEELKKGGHG